MENRDVAVGVLAMDDFAPGWRPHGKPLGSHRHPSIVADTDAGALAEDIGPSRAPRSWPQGPAVFFFGQLPSGLRGATDFAVFFHGVVVASQQVQQGVGIGQGGDAVGCQEGGEAFLPELVAALDFSLGLRGWGKAQGDSVEAEAVGQLRVVFRQMSKEEAVEIDIETQGQAGGLEGLA